MDWDLDELGRSKLVTQAKSEEVPDPVRHCERTAVRIARVSFRMLLLLAVE